MRSFIVTEELERERQYRGQIIGNGRIFDYKIHLPSGRHSIDSLTYEVDAFESGQEVGLYPALSPKVTVSESGRNVPLNRETRLDVLGGWVMATAALTALGVNKGKFTFEDDTLVEKLSS